MKTKKMIETNKNAPRVHGFRKIAKNHFETGAQLKYHLELATFFTLPLSLHHSHSPYRSLFSEQLDSEPN